MLLAPTLSGDYKGSDLELGPTLLACRPETYVGYPEVLHIYSQSCVSYFSCRILCDVQEASFPLGEVVIQIFGRRFAAGAMNEGTVEGVNGKVAVKQVLGRDCLEARAKLIKAGAPYLTCQCY